MTPGDHPDPPNLNVVRPGLGPLPSDGMVMYLLIVYGLGGGWLWWTIAARGNVAVVGAIALTSTTLGLLVAVWFRSRRLRSRFESISPRSIIHGGAGPGSSRWNRKPNREDEPGEFEAHVGGGF